MNNFLRISLILTRTQLKSRYRSTFAGAIWVIVNPILLFIAHAIIFNQIVKINVPNYFLFLLASLIPWTFIVGNINMVTPILVTNREFLNSFNLNPLVLIISQVLDNFINFLISFIVIFCGVFLYVGTSIIDLSYLLIPICVLNLLVFCLGASILCSTMHVYFRDTQYFLNFINSIMYLLTPIFYPVEMVPQWAKIFVTLNPYFIMIHPFQIIFNNYNELSMMNPLIGSSFLGWGILCFSLIIWNRQRDGMYAAL
ncbi:ABC transporter permease [Halobacteriovorax sp. HLS]|uniref:ABC transporter permease n=1 Tax=Halobacteriovorax sp. HLS TaxID=2234000 RepID=UPI000FD8E0D2|nr:ABC transporter permease [Halobacteriovorax sp. HLS]